MCYGMYEKRSAAAKQGVESKSSAAGTTDKATMKTDTAAVRSEAEGKAYSGFRARLQRWIARDEKKQEESVS